MRSSAVLAAIVLVVGQVVAENAYSPTPSAPISPTIGGSKKGKSPSSGSTKGSKAPTSGSNKGSKVGKGSKAPTNGNKKGPKTARPSGSYSDYPSIVPSIGPSKVIPVPTWKGSGKKGGKGKSETYGSFGGR